MMWPHFRIRRATLDDLGQLTALWKSMNFNVSDLARRVTEFQVAEAENGVLAGAIGLQVVERQGLIHGEAFADFALADHLRELLWERLQAVASNQGLLRLWTREDAPFWRRSDLARASEETLASLPAAWRDSAGGWLTLKLRDDLEAIMNADREFAALRERERQKTRNAFRRGRMYYAMALVLAFALVLVAIAAAYYLFWRQRGV